MKSLQVSYNNTSRLNIIKYFQLRIKLRNSIDKLISYLEIHINSDFLIEFLNFICDNNLVLRNYQIKKMRKIIYKLFDNISFLEGASLMHKFPKIELKIIKTKNRKIMKKLVINNALKLYLLNKLQGFLVTFETNKFKDKLNLSLEQVIEVSNLYYLKNYKNARSWTTLKRKVYKEFNNYTIDDQMQLILYQIRIGKFNLVNGMPYYYRIQNNLLNLKGDWLSSLEQFIIINYSIFESLNYKGHC